MLENTTDSVTFVNTFDGRFTVKSDAGNPKAIKRLNANNAEVHELHYDSIGGIIESITEKTFETQGRTSRFIIIVLSDRFPEGTKYHLSIPYSSREAKGLLMRLPNADIKNPLKFKIGKKEHAFTWVTQDGVTVPLRWTKDAPGEMPQMVQIEREGKQVWDDTAQMQFLMAFITNNLFPAAAPQPAPVEPLPAVVDPAAPVEDDLPF